MKKVVLMGNPNVGKSVVFSRLTGAEVITSNYPGTTVDLCKGKMKRHGRVMEIIDAPGTYSLVPTNKAEEVAVKMLEEADVIVNVIDATNLERNLFMTHELLETNKPIIIALNLWDETKHLGIDIDLKKLGALLKVPVVPTVALTGLGINEVVEKLITARSPRSIKPMSEKKRWVKVGEIVKEVQTITHRHHTIWDRIEDATIMPFTGLPLAAVAIFIAFWFVRIIGEGLINHIFNPLFELYRPLMMSFSAWIGPGFLHDFLIGKLIGGEIDFVQSLGMFTTGIFVPFGMVLPYIAAFYLMLGILEDSGYLPRLSTLSDNLFHRLGMHGHGILPLFLGMGCNVSGALAARVLETRKQRFIASTLMAIAIPCMAQSAMIFGILGQYGINYIFLVFLTLALVYIIAGLIMNYFVKGESPEIFLEIPPYRWPSFKTIFKKTWMRIRWFLAEAIPWLFFGVVLINILYAVGFLEWLGTIFSPIIVGIFGLPKAAATALLIGFLRKDLAVGMLVPLAMSPMQLVIAVTILTIYFPCIATFSVMVKELGLKGMLKSAGIMVLTALIVGSLMRVVLL